MNSNYYYGLGKRKTAVAKVRIKEGGAKITINGVDAAEYFPKETDIKVIMAPFETLDMNNKFSVSIIVRGGGKSAQLEACRHGITLALIRFDSGLKHFLRQSGLVTRDPRVVEPKKAGKKKARKSPQWSKR
jgi:small subunit ribosomal protein S9